MLLFKTYLRDCLKFQMYSLQLKLGVLFYKFLFQIICPFYNNNTTFIILFH